ncbi:hypothetical protein [Streptomyces sp. NPDC005141]
MSENAFGGPGHGIEWFGAVVEGEDRLVTGYTRFTTTPRCSVPSQGSSTGALRFPASHGQKAYNSP